MNRRTLGVRALGRAAVWLAASLCAAGAAQAQSHASGLTFHDSFEGPASGPTTDADAARFLTQATFGPTDADITTLRSQGYDAWLTAQFAAPASLTKTYMDWAIGTLGENESQNQRLEAWFLGALGGPDPANNAIIHRDQLRQRVAFALSELLVVSQQNALLAASPRALAYYNDLLVNNAFGNYRTLLEQITLSPAMGVYLNMQGNQRADTAANIHPDENFAREINQLFSVGLVMLDDNGTPLPGNVPTYSQDTIMAFAHVFTGWNFYDCVNFDCGPDQDGIEDNLVHPMVPFKEGGVYPYHDSGQGPDDLVSKQLLTYPGAVNGGVLAAATQMPHDSRDPALDLKFALDNIYNHPNVPSFVAKHLIQRLVTSNPTPAYIGRVAAVFKTNRTAANQLQLVVRAILLDPEARYGHWQAPETFGKLREPLLTLTHFWRAMAAVHSCGHNTYGNQPYRYAGYVSTWSTDDAQYGSGVAQAPLAAPSVFNFFKPNYLPPGEQTTRLIRAPEFQLQTDSIIANTVNSWNMRSFGLDNTDLCDAGDDEGNVTVNHGRDLALAGSANGGVADPADRLVDAYNIRFMSGEMSPFMRQTMISYLNQIDSSWTDQVPSWRYWRVQTALYLIFNSPEYMIQK